MKLHYIAASAVVFSTAVGAATHSTTPATTTQSTKHAHARISFKSVSTDIQAEIPTAILDEHLPMPTTNTTKDPFAHDTKNMLSNIAINALHGFKTDDVITVSTGEVHGSIRPGSAATTVAVTLVLPSTTLATETIIPAELQSIISEHDGAASLSGSAALSGAYQTPTDGPMDVQGGGWWEGMIARSSGSSTSTSFATSTTMTSSTLDESGWSMRLTKKTRARLGPTTGPQRGTIRHSSTSKTDLVDEGRGTIRHSSTAVVQ